MYLILCTLMAIAELLKQESREVLGRLILLEILFNTFLAMKEIKLSSYNEMENGLSMGN